MSIERRDVVVVGAGIAGLSAAVELLDRDVLVLEREPRAGGRICTRHHAGFACDFGAIFALSPELAHGPVPECVDETGPIGLFAEGRWCWGERVVDCVVQLGLSAPERAALDAFVSDPSVDARSLPTRLTRALDSFFRVIHPGRLVDSMPQRQRDALIAFPIRRYVTGNGHFVDAFARALGERLVLGTTVTRVTDEGAQVRVECAGARTLVAKAVICAVPPPALRGLLAQGKATQQFLDTSRFGEGLVVALGLRGAALPPFRYVVTPELPFNTVLRHTGELDRLFVYYVGKNAAALGALSREQIVRATLTELRRLFDVPDGGVAFSDVQHWAGVGPVISPVTYAAFTDDVLRPTPRIVLAGDAVFVERENPFPFGTDQAAASGRRAATLTRQEGLI